MFRQLLMHGSPKTLNGIKFWIRLCAKREMKESEEVEEEKGKEKEKEKGKGKEVKLWDDREEEEPVADLLWSYGLGVGVWFSIKEGKLYLGRLLEEDGPGAVLDRMGDTEYEKGVQLFLALYDWCAELSVGRPELIIPFIYNLRLRENYHLALRIWSRHKKETKLKAFREVMNEMIKEFLDIDDVKCHRAGHRTKEDAAKFLREDSTVGVAWNDPFQAQLEMWWRNDLTEEERLSALFLVFCRHPTHLLTHSH